MSREDPVQRIKVAGRYFVLLPFEDYQALASAAKTLSAGFQAPIDAQDIRNAAPAANDGESSLRAWRKHCGYTLEQLAAKVGSQKSWLSQLETGKAVGSIEVWSKLAKALGTSIDSLVPKVD